MDFSDEVTPLEVAHAAVQADVVDGVVVPFGQDPLIRVVGSGREAKHLFLVSFARCCWDGVNDARRTRCEFR